MTGVQVAYVNGAWQCYRTEDGRRHDYVGCRHLVPRHAIEHTARLEAGQHVSPLRAPVSTGPAAPG